MSSWDESGYELGDPKHPTYRGRMADRADHDRKAARENPPEAPEIKEDEDE